MEEIFVEKAFSSKLACQRGALQYRSKGNPQEMPSHEHLTGPACAVLFCPQDALHEMCVA